jgi:hypothetical protein
MRVHKTAVPAGERGVGAFAAPAGFVPENCSSPPPALGALVTISGLVVVASSAAIGACVAA